MRADVISDCLRRKERWTETGGQNTVASVKRDGLQRTVDYDL